MRDERFSPCEDSAKRVLTEVAPDYQVLESSSRALEAFSSEANGTRLAPVQVALTQSVFARSPVEPDEPFPPPMVRRAAMPLRWTMPLVAGLLGVVVLYSLWNRDGGVPSSGSSKTGTATIDSRPQGIEVAIDGRIRGTTPLTLTLPGGNHQLRLRAGAEERLIPLAITPGASVADYIELGATTPTGSGLKIASELPGSKASEDGWATGKALLTPNGILVRQQPMVAATDASRARGKATPLPAITGSVPASFSQPSTRSGWVSFKAPLEMQVLEGGRVIGTTGVDRLMLPVGMHQLELVNTPLNFRTATSVQIAVSKTVVKTVNAPNGSLSVNARPWADVAIDGNPVGTTPLANISVPIGSHEIVLTHPQRGQRRRTVIVRADSPTRLGVDFVE